MGSISLGVRTSSAMAAVASAPSWIPEDDLLLKNAVELGASLEALAKGAVRFSRKFTVGEIRERWHSLLYDPFISAEASVRMIECETSAKKSGSCKENPETSGKRKAESIRKIYYAMRKRICSQSANFMFSDEADVNAFICNESFVHENHIQGHFGGQDPTANFLNPGLVMDPVAAKETSEKGGYLRDDYCDKFDEKVPEFPVKQLVRKDTESSDGLHEDTLSTHVDRSHPKDCAVLEDVEPGHSLPDACVSNDLIELPSHHSRLPIWKTINAVAAPAILMNDNSIEEVMELCDDLDGEHMCLPDHNNSSEKILSDGNALKQIGSSTALSDNDFVFPEVLWNYEDDLLMDVDEKGTTDKVCNESANFKVLDYANSSVKDDASVPCPTQTLNSNLASCQDANFPPTLDFRVHKLDIDHGYQHGSADIDKLSSTAAPGPHLPRDVSEELMVCTLNSEDPEIPCNNDFIPSTSYHSHKARSSLSLSSANRGNREQGRSFLKKDKNHAQSSEPCQIMGLQASSNFGPKYPLASSGVKCEFASCNYLNSVSRPALNANLDQSPCITASGPLHINGEALTKLESSDICNAMNAMTFTLDAEAGPTRDDFREPQGSPSVVDPEEPESGDDVPCFSDIEAMILDMDLCPDDWDTYIDRQVSRYSHEDAKRAIVRLEQCVQSSIRRAIASRGSLAVLCGRHLKHYIRKPEVILGRSTCDFDVDIDLGRGGGTNKISRRQALIKLEKDGSFSLKNLGRCSMFLNGKEIASGQRLDLSSGCLIEVKGISFLFEMNPESIGQYLAKLR